MARTMSKGEFLRQAIFDQKLKHVKDAGSRVTPTQAEFLREAVYEGYRAAMGQRPRAMLPRERNVKKDYFYGLRSSVADLDAYFTLARTIYQAPAWLKSKDLERAISKGQLASIVSNLCTVLGQEYADHALAALSEVYARAGERIQVVRDAIRR